MNERRPPKTLPAQYLEVWQALLQADRLASSRQVLAGRLGISTHTIQRILVDGSVPRFSGPQSTRVVRAWTRTLTRIAYHLGFEPQTWVEQVGIEWSPETAAASEEALAEQMSRRDGGLAGEPDTSDAQVAASPGTILRSCRNPWQLFLATRPPFGESSYDESESFFEGFGRAILKAIDPRRAVQIIHTKDMLPRDPAQVLKSADSPLPAVGVGYLQTVERIAWGYQFLPLPGLRVQPRILMIKPASPKRGRARSKEAGSPTWQEITASVAGGSCSLYLPAGDPLLRVLGGSHLPVGEPESCLPTLAKQLGSRAEQLVIVSSESFDPAFMNAGLPKGVTLQEIEAGPARAPDFALGLVLKAGGAQWTALLKAALREDLLGSNRASAGCLYGDLVYSAWRQAHVEIAANPVPTQIDWPSLAQASTDRVFCQTAGRQLIDRLSVALASLPGEKEREARIRQIAAQLAPAAWIETPPGEETPREPSRAGAVRMPDHGRPELAPFCHSCSTPLEIEQNRGASDRFCRYCSDKQGRLRPREEVEELLSGWFRAWQRDISAEEARRRAQLYMEALPAWSSN